MTKAETKRARRFLLTCELQKGRRANCRMCETAKARVWGAIITKHGAKRPRRVLLTCELREGRNGLFLMGVNWNKKSC